MLKIYDQSEQISTDLRYSGYSRSVLHCVLTAATARATRLEYSCGSANASN